MFIAALSLPQLSFGHFLWIVPETGKPEAKKAGTKVHLYFSESASPDDPDLLKKVKSPQMWWRNAAGVLEPIFLHTGDDSLEGKLPEAGAAATYGLSQVYGAMTRGKETFLLKYHAKAYGSSDPATWKAVAKADALPLEIVPLPQAGQLGLSVLWQGKPLAGALVTLEGPGVEKREGKTNDQGLYTTSLTKSGLFSIRAKHTEAASGKLDKDAYTSVRHYATLSLPVEVARLGSASGAVKTTPAKEPRAETKSPWPQLDVGLASFGAAIIGDDLYVYGGHLGKTHHYYSTGESGDLRKLNLKKPGKWEVVSTGPRRTGLAMVTHGGKLYRIGGFDARNGEKEKQNLFSMPDFARFDPKTGKWEDLPAMPKGRSSHDAVVAGNYLYVAGGWEMQGEGKKTVWHDTAYRVDLSQPVLKWELLPKQPFQRRGLALATWNDKIYVIGGMEQEGGATTEVAIYDPVAKKWSEGPDLLGDAMDGFASAAYPCGKSLWVTTLSGSILSLTADGKEWKKAGQLGTARFFHRMLPLDDQRMVLVGGANMKIGKIRELEAMTVTNLTPR